MCLNNNLLIFIYVVIHLMWLYDIYMCTMHKCKGIDLISTKTN